MTAAASLVADVDVHVVQEHLNRYAVSCPLCRATGRMAVAHQTCAIEAHDGDGVEVVLVVCKRCGYLMPLAADRVVASNLATSLAAA